MHTIACKSAHTEYICAKIETKYVVVTLNYFKTIKYIGKEIIRVLISPIEFKVS